MTSLSPQSRTAIETFLSTPQGVLGSQIGEFIRTSLSDITLPEIKMAHGGLRQFFQKHFPGQIVEIGRKGADTVWRFGEDVSNTGMGPDVDNSAKLWSLFTNPKKQGKLFIIGDALEFHLQEPPDGKELERMKLQDHLAIVKAFIAKCVGPEDQVSFNPAIEQGNDYWPHFLKAIEQSQAQGTDYFTRWKRFRQDSIEQVFRERCADIVVAPVLTERLWRQLRGLAPTPNTKIRDNIIEALSHLSEDDFEKVQISLPMALLSRMLKK